MLYIHSITMPLKMFISKSVVKNLISENLWWSIKNAHWYARREERKQRIWLKHEVTMLMKIYIRKSRPRTKYKRFLGNNVKNIGQYTQIIFNFVIVCNLICQMKYLFQIHKQKKLRLYSNDMFLVHL